MTAWLRGGGAPAAPGHVHGIGQEPAMIHLHRLGTREEPFLLNADLIATVEAHPDTVIALTTGRRFIVAETPAEVIAAVRAWRAGLMSELDD